MHGTSARDRRLYLRYDATRNVWILDDSSRRRPLSLLYRIRITKGVASYCLQVLYNVLSSGYRYGLPSRTPYNLTEGASRTRSRHQLMNPKRNRRAALNASDCEDNSSGGEEDFTQVGIFWQLWRQRWIILSSVWFHFPLRNRRKAKFYRLSLYFHFYSFHIVRLSCVINCVLYVCIYGLFN